MSDLELSYEEIDRYIGEISSGKKISYIQQDDASELPLLFKHPSYRDKELASFIYNQAFKEAEKMELPSVHEMEHIIQSRGLFSKRNEEELASLQSKLEGQKLILAKTTRVPAHRENRKKIIAEIEEKILELKLKKERLFDFTKERKASEEKLLYLTWRGVFDPFNEQLYWSDYESFKDEVDFGFRRRVFVNYTLFSFGLESKHMRQVARSSLWRIRYIHSLKTGASLFGRDVIEFTGDQLMLCYWSNYYQSIYEMPSTDRPPDSIIEDDAALDAYMKDWSAERSREDTASQAKNKKYGVKSAWDYQETLVMRSSDIFEDVDYSKTKKEEGKTAGKTASDAASFGRGKNRR